MRKRIVHDGAMSDISTGNIYSVQLEWAINRARGELALDKETPIKCSRVIKRIWGWLRVRERDGDTALFSGEERYVIGTSGAVAVVIEVVRDIVSKTKRLNEPGQTKVLQWL